MIRVLSSTRLVSKASFGYRFESYDDFVQLVRQTSLVGCLYRQKVIAIAPRRYLYSIALARQLPDNFADALSTNDDFHNPKHAVNMKVAKTQHDEYIQALRQCVPVLELPAVSRTVIDSEDNGQNGSEYTPTHNFYPDCVFVEDTVVAFGQYALVTRMGHPSRRGEEKHVYEVLKQLGMNVINMNDYRDSMEWIYGTPKQNGEIATVDGGDVLYTGRHIFIGLSNRTNMEGATFIKHYFSSFDVEIVPLPIAPEPSGHPMPLHLKSIVTHVDAGNLLVPMGPIGDQLIEAMRVKELDYTVHRLPEMLSCNVVACNGQVIVQNTVCQESQKILHNVVMETDQDLICVDTSELAKKDGALTCCSVLLEA